MTTDIQTSASSPSHTPTDLQSRIRSEYLEMPGLRLSLEQASRLWGLDRAACEGLLDALVGISFLHRDRDGRFLRRGSGY
jgi:hypothetical protein